MRTIPHANDDKMADPLRWHMDANGAAHEGGGMAMHPAARTDIAQSSVHRHGKHVRSVRNEYPLSVAVDFTQLRVRAQGNNHTRECVDCTYIYMYICIRCSEQRKTRNGGMDCMSRMRRSVSIDVVCLWVCAVGECIAAVHGVSPHPRDPWELPRAIGGCSCKVIATTIPNELSALPQDDSWGICMFVLRL